MGGLARRVAEGPCLGAGHVDTGLLRGVVSCAGMHEKHPECAVAVFKEWLEEQEGPRGQAIVLDKVPAFRSAAEFLLETFKRRKCDSDGVSDCVRCNAVALSWMLLKALDSAALVSALEEGE